MAAAAEEEPLNPIEEPSNEQDKKELDPDREIDPKHPETMADYNKVLKEYKLKLSRFSWVIFAIYAVTLVFMVGATSIH
jgi:hypothetical protein